MYAMRTDNQTDRVHRGHLRSLLAAALLAVLLSQPTDLAAAALAADVAAVPRHGAVGREGSGPDTLPDTEQVIDEKGQALRVTPLKGLERPWALAFLPDGAMLVTERPGQLRRVDPDFTLDPQPVAGVPAVLASAYKGLMDVALHPAYAENRWVYLTYSKRLPGETDADWDQLTGPAGTAVLARGRALLVFELPAPLDPRAGRQRDLGRHALEALGAQAVQAPTVRIVPPDGVEIDPVKRPFVVVDPRAGHGPEQQDDGEKMTKHERLLTFSLPRHFCLLTSDF